MSRLLLAHLAWSAVVLGAAAAVIALERSTPCPPGGWLALDCGPSQDLFLALIGLSAVVYVVILSVVLAWATRATRRPGADPHGAIRVYGEQVLPQLRGARVG